MEYENPISKKELKQICNWSRDVNGRIYKVDPLYARVNVGLGMEIFISKNNLSSGWTWHITDDWLLMRISGGSADKLEECLNQAWSAVPKDRKYFNRR